MLLSVFSILCLSKVDTVSAHTIDGYAGRTSTAAGKPRNPVATSPSVHACRYVCFRNAADNRARTALMCRWNSCIDHLTRQLLSFASVAFASSS
ncbi:hypothetical protein C8R45DRAFT_1038389 [Mycena sanguinolenta]|nr:hypothetical protein C8R45DRAFT_1038389 [Mycena sanguinolenta]